jgi:hypothetical protein
MIEVESITENEDGSADVLFNMTQDELLVFAKIGLLKVLTDSTKAVIETQSDGI